MAKKIFVTAFAIVVLCLCCGMCFAAEDKGSSINLGNEIMDSVDKAGKSVGNVVSGNIVKDAGNTVRNTGNDIKDGARNLGNDGKNVVGGVVNRAENGAYNTTRTTAEGTTTNGGFSTMTTTTWMWIILVVAAIVIIAAIWYYATRSND